MASYGEHYCDPTVASDGGDGSIGSPWTRADGNVIQYALSNWTIVSGVDNRLNIKAGVPHTGMTTRISHTDAPSANQHTVFQGYTSVAGDGGRGVIKSAGGITDNAFAAQTNYVDCIDVEFDGWGCQLREHCAAIRVEVHGGSARGIHINSNDSVCVGCYVHDMVSTSNQFGIHVRGRAVVHGNYVEGTNLTRGIYHQGSTGTVTENIVDMSDEATVATTPYYCSGNVVTVLNNTFIGNDVSGGYGVYFTSSTTQGIVMANNIIANSPTFPSRGIRVNNTSHPIIIANSLYDFYADFYSANEHPYAVPSEYENEVLVSSPFTDFANKDFTPVDVGEVLNPWCGIKEWAGTKPGITGYRGAVPPAAAGGGGKQAILATMGFSS